MMTPLIPGSLNSGLVLEKSGCSRKWPIPCAKVQADPLAHAPMAKNLHKRVLGTSVGISSVKNMEPPRKNKPDAMITRLRDVESSHTSNIAVTTGGSRRDALVVVS